MFGFRLEVGQDEAAHLLPIEDAIEHETSDACACGPTAIPLVRFDEPAVDWLVQHHSLDGRETLRVTPESLPNSGGS